MSDQTSEVLRRVDEIQERVIWQADRPLYKDVEWLCSQLRTALKDTERVEPIIKAAQELDNTTGAGARWGAEMALVCVVRNYFAALPSPPATKR